MPSRPIAVLSQLVAHFGAGFKGEITQEEAHLAGRLKIILEESRDYGFEIEDSEEVEIDRVVDDPTWNFDDQVLPPAKYDDLIDDDEIYFGKSKVKLGKVKEAIKFYRDAQKGSRTISAMNQRFRFLKKGHHLRKLRQIEEDLNTGGFRISRLQGLAKIAKELFELVKKKDEEGAFLHDLDIQQMAMRINEGERYVKNFKASDSWIYSFKKAFNIGSRHVTKIVSRRNLVDNEKLKKTAEEFVQKVKDVIRAEKIPLENVWNADQSGIQKILTSNRTLTILGGKRVERVVDSVSATTHSITVMPTLSASGDLGDQLYVVHPEASGHFPEKNKPWTAPNLCVSAKKGHIMNKDLMGVWLENCIVKDMPDKVLLLIDSWSSFKDHQYIQSKVPPNKKLIIMNIPPGTTCVCQPLDVYFFQQFKKYIKYLINYAYVHDIVWKPQLRDNTFKTVSVIYRQFKADRFKEYRKYAWFKAGYTDRPSNFVTPPKYCTSFQGSLRCSKTNCNDFGCVKCAWCQEILCFKHFVIEPHTSC